MSRCSTVAKTAPLDRKLEQALGEQAVDHRAAAGFLPQPPEQQGCSDALGEQARTLQVGLQGGQQQDLLTVARARGKQGGQGTAGGELVGAAEGGDDVLPHRAAVASVLHDL